MSRVTRGRLFATTKEGGEGVTTGTEVEESKETVLGSPNQVQEQGQKFMIGGKEVEVLLQGGDDSTESQSQGESESETSTIGRVILDEEAGARRARASRASEMWVKHAPVRPVHDVGHEGREEGKSSRGEL